MEEAAAGCSTTSVADVMPWRRKVGLAVLQGVVASGGVFSSSWSSKPIIYIFLMYGNLTTRWFEYEV